MIEILSGEVFQLERALRRLLQKRKKSGFSVSLFEGKEATAEKILEAGRSLPLLGGEAIVLVREAGGLKKGELEKLENFLESMTREGHFIFSGEKIDRRLGFWQKVARQGNWQEFRPLYQSEIPGWIVREGKERGKKVSSEAAEWLAGQLGQELGLIDSALEKVLLLIGGKETVEVADLEKTVQFSSLRSVFELTDAIGAGHRARALKLAHQLIDGGESPVGLVALIARHLRLLWRVKETGQGAPPYFLKNYQSQAAGWSVAKLEEGLDQIFKTDWAIKSSPLPPDFHLERLICAL